MPMRLIARPTFDMLEGRQVGILVHRGIGHGT